MDYAKIQQKVDKGYGKAALRVGQTFNIYKSSNGVMNPLDPANVTLDTVTNLPVVINASITPVMDYSRYNKPQKPDWFFIGDTSLLNLGDWLVCTDTSNRSVGTIYVADLQPLLPTPVVQCNTLVDIKRVDYSDLSGGFQGEEFAIATSFPVFMINKKDKAHVPVGMPAQSMSEQGVLEYTVYINSHDPAFLKSEDVLVDPQGMRFQIMAPNYTAFGYIAIARTLMTEAQP